MIAALERSVETEREHTGKPVASCQLPSLKHLREHRLYNRPEFALIRSDLTDRPVVCSVGYLTKQKTMKLSRRDGAAAADVPRRTPLIPLRASVHRTLGLLIFSFVGWLAD